MRDRSKQLLVINTGKKESGQTGLPSQAGTTHIIGGGVLSVNMSDYLLKSIWDKVFEIRTDSQGIEYIFGKLPMVTQYGITMYSGDGVDIPSLASGLPFDGRTIWYNPDTQQIEVIGGTGGGSGEGVSNFWDLSGIPSWITNTKPKYTYSEIEGTPDLTQYALVSQIPSLSGYATESWVLQKNYATKATTLSGYGITDAYTKTNVDDLLKAYVTLGGRQTITGEKNFTGGLKVNGSPIYYDTEKKYWKLEGDLLVTGGVTMYGSDSSFTPSTIMDAILYDDATLGINSNGQLYVKGGTSGGGLDITALQNYLTQNSYLNVTEGDGRYLKLSGGTLSGGASISWGDANNGLTDTSDWNIKTDGLRILSSITSGSNAPSQYAAGLHVVGRYGFQIACEATSSNFYMRNIRDGINDWCKLWHAGNFTPSNYLPLSGGTMTGNILLGGTTTNKIGTNIVDTSGGFQEFTHQNSNGYIALGPFNGSVAHIYTDRPSFYFNKDLYVNDAKVWNASNDGSGSTLDADLLDGKHLSDILASNVASATKLQTARTIWGQSFDGTKDIDGDITIKGALIGKTSTTGNLESYVGNASGGVGGDGALMYAYGSRNLYFYTKSALRMIIESSGNVGIGTTSPSYKLDVSGEIRMSGAGIIGGGLHFTGIGSGVYNKGTIMSTNTYGYEIEAPRATDSATGTALPIFIGWRGGALGIKITSGGNLLANGGITMYSDQRKKTILNHVELSLKQIAEAPLIEHYYNSDEKKTTHVGSIAQYWASMNDWFCKLDSEGFYTMEIQNAALASAISIARELDRYETKTDKAIKKLKKRICELEEEVERLKSA